MAKETSRERRKRQQDARNELRKQNKQNSREEYQEYRKPREYKPYEGGDSSERRSFRSFDNSFHRKPSSEQQQYENKKYDKPFQKPEESTEQSSPSLPAPEILDIQSEYFQKEYNPKKIALSEITELKLNGKGFKDIKNLNLLVNLKRLEVIKNKLSSLKFMKGVDKIQHLDAHENEIVSSDDKNTEITEFIQNSPQLKVLNLSHNQLVKTIVVKAKLAKAAEPVLSGIAEKLNRGKKVQQQPKDNLNSGLLALILTDNKIEELKLEGKFQVLNTIIISKNPMLKKFTDYYSVPQLTKFGATETAIEQLHASVSLCKQLQELRLSHNPQLFTKETCLKTLLEIEKMDSLKLLALSHNKISMEWNVMKSHLIMIIKRNRNLRNLSIVGNFEEYLEKVGAEKFKDEILSLFTREGIYLTHLDDKPVGEKPARNSRPERTNSRDNRERGERSERGERKPFDSKENREKRDSTKSKERPRKQDNQTEKTEEKPVPVVEEKSEEVNSQLDDYQAIQIPVEMQVKMQRELMKRKQENSDQSLVVQNAKDQQEEKKRKRELLGGFVEQDDKHSGVKKFVNVNTYKKRKSNVFQMMGQDDDAEEGW